MESSHAPDAGSLSSRLDNLEALVLSMAASRSAELLGRQRPDSAEAAVPASLAKDGDPKRPLQTDGIGPWPPVGEPLPEGWEELPLDDSGAPGRPGWDPWNPEIPPSGKVLTYDPERRLFRIECGGVRYEVPWGDLEPPPPFSNPGPPQGLTVDPGFVWVQVTPRAVRRRCYFRQAHCKTQITCVVDFEIVIDPYRVWSMDMEGRVIEWLTYPYRDRRTRHETRRRTSDFTCPQQRAL